MSSKQNRQAIGAARRHNESHTTMSVAGNRITQIGIRCHQRPSCRPIHAAAIVRPAAIVASASSEGHPSQIAAGALRQHSG